MVSVPLVFNAVSSMTEPVSTPIWLALLMTAASLVPVTVMMTLVVEPSAKLTIKVS
jgi:hypothetical protein